MPHYHRTTVLCIGSLGVSRKPFDERDLPLVNVGLSDAISKFNQACAIIIAEPRDKTGLVRECLFKLKTPAEEYGLKFSVMATDSVHHRVLTTVLNDLGMGSSTTIYSLDALSSAAQDIFTTDPGPPLGKAKILTAGFNVPRSHKQLLRRAFYDCDRIYLRRLDGGRKSLNVFCVDAWLTRSEVGPRPLPFFVKISDPKTVSRELSNYHEYAEFFIPFYLRPNLDRRRCLGIGSLSAIVGNLVEDAQSLRSVLRSNPGPGIIFSLFENSLKGFRLQPPESHMIREGLLEDFIKDRTRASEVPKKVVAHARQLGLEMSPAKLEELLCSLVKGVKCRFGPHHGDLHPGNVMVRGKDAILIDFSAVRDAPVTADLAAMEVSLVFGTDAVDRADEFRGWRQLVNKMYQKGLHRQPPAGERSPGPHSWLRKAVREIRHVSIGCDCSEYERSAVFAAHLIRFARLEIEDFPDSALRKIAADRHAYAMVIAERILKFLLASERRVVK